MYSTDRELSFIGAPILLDNVCLIKPKTVLDKIKLGYKYDTCLGLLTLSSSDIEDILFKKLGADMKELASITPFEYLLLSADNNETFFMELKEAFVTFIQEDIHIIPKAGIVLVGDLNNQFIIDKNNFSRFQEILRIQNHLDQPEEVPENENYMERKFRLRRKELKEAKAKQAKKDEKSPDFVDLMSSLCVMNIGVTWNNIKELPIYTFYELLGRNQKKEKYELDIRSLLAGADKKNIKLEYWISKIENN